MYYRDRRTMYYPLMAVDSNGQPTDRVLSYQSETFPSINAAKAKSRLLGGSQGLVRVGKPPRNVAAGNDAGEGKAI